MTANGVHIPRAPSMEEVFEIEKLAACGRYSEAAKRFGGRVVYSAPVISSMQLEAAIREAIRIGSQPHYGDNVTALDHYEEAMEILRKALK